MVLQELPLPALLVQASYRYLLTRQLPAGNLQQLSPLAALRLVLQIQLSLLACLLPVREILLSPLAQAPWVTPPLLLALTLVLALVLATGLALAALPQALWLSPPPPPWPLPQFPL